MNTNDGSDRLLAAWFEADAPASAPDALRTDIYSVTAAIRPRPAWLARLRGNPMDVIAGGAARRNSRLVPILIVVGLLLALLAVGLYAGSSRPPEQLSFVPPPSAASPATRPVATPSSTRVTGLTGLIAFTRVSAASRSIHVTSPDGSGLRLLISLSGNNDMPAWSPDNSHIAWSAEAGISVATSEGKGVTQITDGGKKDRDPAWSPDGSTLVFAGNRDGDYDLYAQRRDHPEMTQLTRNDVVDDGHPSWSAVTNRIAFFSNRDSSYDIWTMKPDGTDLAKITRDAAKDEDPAWSPDGSRIAFTSDREGSPAIFVMRADGTGIERLARGTAIESDAAWSPDGRFIAFHRAGVHSAIVIVDVASHQEVAEIFKAMSETQAPAWRSN
jgi:Tol biopolymer transport system component